MRIDVYVGLHQLVSYVTDRTICCVRRHRTRRSAPFAPLLLPVDQISRGPPVRKQSGGSIQVSPSARERLQRQFDGRAAGCDGQNVGRRAQKSSRLCGNRRDIAA